MCERTHVGCPDCDGDTSEIVAREQRTEIVGYPLDSEGSIDDTREPEYDEDPYCEAAGYFCKRCGWQGSALNHEASEESCECDECCEPEADDPGPDPDRIVVLRRLTDRRIDFRAVYDEPAPELLRLWESRATTFQPLPRWRAAEIHRDFLDRPDVDHCVQVDFNFDLPDEAAYDLILPGFDPTKPNYKGAPDDRHVAACA